MVKRLFHVFLWTFLLVNVFWITKDLVVTDSFIETFKLVMENQHTFLDAFLFSFLIFMIINVIFVMVLCIYKILCNLIILCDIKFTKPKIKEMSMHIDDSGIINRSYFITVDNERIPVNVYQAKKEEVKENNE